MPTITTTRATIPMMRSRTYNHSVMNITDIARSGSVSRRYLISPERSSPAS